MIKKIDFYLIKKFFPIFLFIFSILFFLFNIQFGFQEISKLVGKGFTIFQILKILFYLGSTTIPIVVPISILLASIMCFSECKENNEIIAIQCSGISLLRILFSNFFFSILISIILFFFSNYILPKNYQIAKNLLVSSFNANPILRFTDGEFNHNIPGFIIKIDKIYEKKSNLLKNILIYKKNDSSHNIRTIIAKNGYIYYDINNSLLKFKLKNGIIYESKNHFNDINKKIKQPNRIIEFKILYVYIDIRNILNKILNNEKMQDSFRFYQYNEIINILDSIKLVNDSIFLLQANNYFNNFFLNKSNYNSTIINRNNNCLSSYKFFDKNIKKIILKKSILKIEEEINKKLIPNNQLIFDKKKEYVRIVIYQQKIISLSIASILFFLIGAPLGTIIKKNGIALPVIIAISIFIFWFIISTFLESKSKNFFLDPYLAVWIPNFILFILSFYIIKIAKNNIRIFI